MKWLVLALALQEGREVVHTGAPVEVRVPVSTDQRHRAAVISFPETSLEALVAGWDEKDLSIERRRENLFIKLLRPAEGDLHVLGGSGTLYRLALRPAEGAYDGWVRIAAPRESKPAPPEPVELLRAMRLGRRPSEGRVYGSKEEVYRSPELAIRLAYVYETTAFRGYVARAENVSARSQRLDPSRFLAKDLVLAGAREMLLKPGESTLLYLVFAKEP